RRRRPVRTLPLLRLRPRHRAGLCRPGGAPRRPTRSSALEELPEAAARARRTGAEARRPRQVGGTEGVATLGAVAEAGRLVSRVPAVRMHEDELDIDAELARRLLSLQFPEWADLPLAPVLPAGTDHAIFRLGDDMSVRIPRREGIEDQADL